MAPNNKFKSAVQKISTKLTSLNLDFLADKNSAQVVYKLLHDTLLLLLFTFFVLLLAESALPGLLSRFFSILQVTLLLTGNLLAIAYLGKKHNFVAADPNHLRHSALIFALVTVIFLLVGNSMLKFTLWQNLLITVTTILVIFYLKRILLDERD